nr:MAG TPA: hypothetical protein [Caudoviricetes sp.]
MISDPYIYFLYSEIQKNEREKMEAKLSRTFIPGIVIVNGAELEFTEISTSNKNMYVDCKLIAEGLQSRMKYKDISSAPTWNMI